MNYQKLEKTSMCYRCKNKEICKIVYQANDSGIQQANWDCLHFIESEPLKDREFLLTLMQSVMTTEQMKEIFQKMIEEKNRWIPVSEKLPADRDWYLGVFREPDTDFIGIPYICDYVGEVTKGTTNEGWILRGFTDIDDVNDYIKSLECVAWQPLPEPYKGGEE